MSKIVIIGGCGHVGLPFGVVLAGLEGFEVACLDVDQSKVDQVNSGVMPFLEVGIEPLLKEALLRKKFRATTDVIEVGTADIVITVIGTPVDRYQAPLLQDLNEHADATINRMKDGAMLILRSTLYPGTSKMVYDRIQRLNHKVHLAVCPERIAEGKALEELTTLPQIVGAFDDESMDKASQFFMRITKSVIQVTPLEAEIGKLLVNAWRYLNFAVSNQMYMMCTKSGVDFYRMYDAFKKDYPRMSSLPTAGFAAGPCLLKDTLQLCAFSNNQFFFGNSAVLVNESLPNFVLEQLADIDLANKRVAILGTAFKPESDDIRDSLAYKVRKLMCIYAKEVFCTDPYVDDPRLVPLDTALANADVIILGTPHKVYKDLTFRKEVRVVDVWGFWQLQNPPVFLTAPDSESEPESYALSQEKIR